MEEHIMQTKKGLIEFLNERLRWFINYGNPFQEATMVLYINKGIEKLNALDVTDDTMIVMYDKDDELQFEVVRAEA